MDGCWWNCRFSICRQISQVRTCNNFRFLNSQRTCQLCIKKAPKQAKDFFNMVSVSLEGLSMFSDRIVDFWFIAKFHSSGPAIIFSFWSLTEHVSYISKKAPKQAKTPHQHGQCYSGRIMDGFWWNCRFSIFHQISQVGTCNVFKVFNYHRAC